MDSITSNVFILSTPTHLVFCFLAFIFFIKRYFSYKKPYQLLFAITIPSTLILRLVSFIPEGYKKIYVDIIGIAEIIFLLFGFVLIIIECVKNSKNNKKDAADGKTAKGEEKNV